jgi:catechol 2,3-dioxygenase-like lactoylglutathione lyase family enzyme
MPERTIAAAPAYGEMEIDMTRTKSSAANVIFTAVVLLGLGRLAAQAPAPAENPLRLMPSHITLSVADIDKESAWYHDVLGFVEYERILHGTDFVHCSLKIPGVYRVDLNWQKGSARHTAPGFEQAAGSAGKGSGNMEQGYTHIVFKTPISLDIVNQQLTAKNANVAAAKDKNGAVTNILVYDPEGNEIEIQHYDPEAK